MEKKEIALDYSLEGTDITYEVVDGYLVVKTLGMTVKPHTTKVACFQ